MSATQEITSEKINELTALIVEAKSKGDNDAVLRLEGEKTSLLKQLNEYNQKSSAGNLLTDTRQTRSVMKG
jgi:hypothetical protein